MFVLNIIQNTTSSEVIYFSMTLPHKISWSSYVALLISLNPHHCHVGMTDSTWLRMWRLKGLKRSLTFKKYSPIMRTQHRRDDYQHCFLGKMIIWSKLHQPLHLQTGQPRSLVRSPCTQVLLQSINGWHSLHLQTSQPTLFSRNPWEQFFRQSMRAGQAVGPTCNAKHSHNLFPWLSCK